MIEWDIAKEERLEQLVSNEARHSEYKIADIMTKEFGEEISRNAVHNKMRRLCINFDSTKKQPKILLFDIETAPNVVYTWGLFKQNVSVSQIVSPSFMICWAGKWLFDDKIMSDCISPTDVISGNDASIARSLWAVMDEADIIVAHNGVNFDIPWANSRFIYYGMVPPSPYCVIDTLKVCRQQFNFTSNRLEWIAKYLTKDQKIKTDFGLWSDCMRGNSDALNKMSEYNIQDTILLEEVYILLRPWVRNHPNLGLYFTAVDKLCAHCGSDSLTPMTKLYTTSVNVYQTYRCNDCGAVNRVRVSSGNTSLRSLAR